MSHVPCSLVGDRKLTLKFLGGDPFSVGADQVDSHEPLSEAHVGIVEDGPNSHRELVVAGHALIDVAHLPCFTGSVEDGDAGALAPWALGAFWPADMLQMLNTGFLGRELAQDLEDRWLRFVGLSDSFDLPHDTSMP